MSDFINDIRGVLIPVTAAQVVLPNAAIAEIISFTPPGTLKCDQNWILGAINWRGWSVPVFSFSILTGLVDEESDQTARIAVIKALTGSTNMPFFAMQTQGFPQLASLSKYNVVADKNTVKKDGVAYEVHIEGQPAWLPDLAYIEKELSACLAEVKKTGG